MDAAVLFIGGGACVYTMPIDWWFGIAIAFVVLHFFIFCNVLRMSRSLELVWAGAFAGMVIMAISFGFLTWPLVLAISLVVTLAVAVIELRRPSYHGVGWRRVNPRLPEWWKAAAGREGRN